MSTLIQHGSIRMHSSSASSAAQQVICTTAEKMHCHRVEAKAGLAHPEQAKSLGSNRPWIGRLHLAANQKAGQLASSMARFTCSVAPGSTLMAA